MGHWQPLVAIVAAAEMLLNDPGDSPSEGPCHIEESAMDLQIIVEDDWGPEEEDEPAYSDEPAINLIYG